MSDIFLEMLKNVERDPAMRDAMLAKLVGPYTDTILPQNNRPKTMRYFDLYMSEVRTLRVQELIEARKQGRKVIGSFCSFVPEELVIALGGVHVGICTGVEIGTELAEKVLPPSTCALIKSFFGFRMLNACPYMENSDLIVGENTCDGKKKAYEIFSGLVNRFHVLDMPQMKTPAGKQLLKSEYARFGELLEEMTGNKLEYENLSRAIDLINERRKALIRLNELRKNDPTPISGLDALLVNQLCSTDDPKRFAAKVNELCDELDERVRKGEGVAPKGTKRMVVSGCPMAIPNWKVPASVETQGAVIVGEESCTGERSSRWLTEKRGMDVAGLIDDLTDRYFKIDCAVFTPNNERIGHIEEMVARYRADGLVHYSLQFCQPYQIESHRVENEMKKNGTPTLRIETNYGKEDAAQIKTRVGAFLEMLG